MSYELPPPVVVYGIDAAKISHDEEVLVQLRRHAGDAGVLFIPETIRFPDDRPRVDWMSLILEWQRAYVAKREALLVVLLARNPWALHAAATLPGWRAYADAVRR